MKRGNTIAASLTLFLLLALSSIGLISQVNAATTTYVQEINYTLEQPFGGLTTVHSWGEYIQTVYRFALGLVSIIAVVLIMIGGVRWIVAAGNESAIGEAKEMISSAVIGLIIALLSYTILLFINPKLVEQSFSVAKIPVPNSDGDFWEREWCNDTSPAIASEECNSASSGTLQCSDVPCGDTATYEWGGATTICRGGKCAAGDGTPGCYQKPTNPYSEATCQLQDCGSWASNCYGKYSDPNDIDDYKNCLCGYYQTTPMKLMGAGSNSLSYSDEQYVPFAIFCSEDISQEDLVTDITNNANGYYTPTSTAGLKDIGLNCNFGCEAYAYSTEVTLGGAASTVVYSGGITNAALTYLITWLVEEVDPALTCQKS